ncbi:hypothetical protein ACP4OV_031202 [Aristida adscensionis]
MYMQSSPSVNEAHLRPPFPSSCDADAPHPAAPPTTKTPPLPFRGSHRRLRSWPSQPSLLLARPGRPPPVECRALR